MRLSLRLTSAPGRTDCSYIHPTWRRSASESQLRLASQTIKVTCSMILFPNRARHTTTKMLHLEQTRGSDTPYPVSSPDPQEEAGSPISSMARESTVVTVLGGPGSGKGTQCGRIALEHNIAHLSVGDVLRAEMARPDSPYASIIEDNIRNGRVGPMEITIGLLGNAIREIMAETGNTLFLLDGRFRAILCRKV